MLTVKWGNSLEKLAEQLFSKLDKQTVPTPDAVFARRDCIVVPNRLQQVWLQQYFLYDRPRAKGLNVLANCDFPLLNVFVNDCLFRMTDPAAGGKRDPDAHPFSVKSMRWRIHAWLESGELFETTEFSALKRYVAGPDGRPDVRRCFKLAARLAKLMDEYVVYRPEMVAGWEQGKDEPATDQTRWEPALWRKLVDGDWKDGSYLAAFLRMQQDLNKSGIHNEYRRISVFAPSIMPRVYMVFFHYLGNLMDVDLHLFNPAALYWCDDVSLRSRIAQGKPLSYEGLNDSESLFSTGHPLLGLWARGCRDLIAETIDLTGGETQDSDGFSNASGAGALSALQAGITANDTSLMPVPDEALDSIQIHLCHGPMREVEVLRDQILHCFKNMPDLQPRHIQVQVADMTAYAPYIEAVFSTQNRSGVDAIPFVIADRVVSGESVVAVAFRQLLELSDSRFTAPDVLSLLRCESLSAAFGFDATDVDSAAEWLKQAGVRWGRDAEHRAKMTQARFTEQTTWRYGLDRLLLGYALGRDPVKVDSVAALPPCDCVEGDDAVLLGRLARFYEALTGVADYCEEKHPVDAWIHELERMIDVFFVSSNETYADVNVLKRAVHALRTSVEAAGYERPVQVAVIRDFLAGQLDEAAGGADSGGNAVIFCGLRPGSSVPRRVMCMLGMGDGAFPRTENRPAYDLMRGARKMGDRSASIEDRMAWLEAIMNASEKLLIFYPAFSQEDNEPANESIVVRELIEYLSATFGETSFRKIRHHLQGFHPDYFLPAGKRREGIFSYSGSNCAAAGALLTFHEAKAAGAGAAESAPAVTPANPLSGEVTLKDLAEFFKNPAKFFYTRILGVRLEPADETSLEDSESFDPGGLEGYQIRDRIVKEIVSGPGDEAALRQQLTAAALLPLESWGERWFHKEWMEVEALLASRWGALGSLKAALQKQSTSIRTELDVMAGTDRVRVIGAVPIFNIDVGTETLLTFRSGNPKAATRLESWLTHLLACAGGRAVTSYVVEAKNLEKAKVFVCVPVAKDDASGLLTGYVNIYRAGLVRIDGFTPETALAYAAKLRDVKLVGTDDFRHGAALEASRKQWESNDFQPARDGDHNPYFLHAFGLAGPFRNESSLVELAHRIMDPMLAHQAPVESGGA